MNSGINIIGAVASTLIMFSCVEPYQQPSVAGDVDILVVDGYVNTADGSALVVLSRARALSSDSVPSAELNATVRIKSGNNTYTLSSEGSGHYAFSGIDITPGSTYQLLIHTRDQQDYSSDEVESKQTPPIDSITWSADGDKGIFVNVNTHDPTGNSQYYRWDFVETWQYHSTISSDYKVVNNEIIPRENSERIYTCWRTDTSRVISIGSTVRLAQDIISQHPLTFIPRESNRLMVKYSVLVKQRIISKKEYAFLEQLKKSTESLGSLFDPLPSQVVGNIQNLNNPSTPVLGYFSAGATQEQRIFINRMELPDEIKKPTFNAGCTPDTLLIAYSGSLSSASVIGNAVYKMGALYGYTISNTRCADCRFYKGVTTKPDFWP